MPYTDPTRRDALVMGEVLPQSAGELNFLFSDTIDSFLRRKGLTYAHLNEVIGALECAKLELYRRIAAPFEDSKIIANGDVYSHHVA